MTAGMHHNTAPRVRTFNFANCSSRSITSACNRRRSSSRRSARASCAQRKRQRAQVTGGTSLTRGHTQPYHLSLKLFVFCDRFLAQLLHALDHAAFVCHKHVTTLRFMLLDAWRKLLYNNISCMWSVQSHVSSASHHNVSRGNWKHT